MRTITVINNVTLDGVMQAPGGAEEDTRDGFTQGGWAVPYHDEVMMREMSKGFGTTELLFGRRTYQQFYSFWPQQTDNSFTEVLNNTQKYVASTTLSEPLPWQNSTLLGPDAVSAVAELKQQPGRDLVLLGSGVLINALAANDLIDEYTLMIHPLVLGAGRRLFAGDTQASLKLVDSVPTSTGVIIATYQPAR
ncbi:MAG: dihydrofolate reductase family protein [Micromonosporaceae bacterium]